MSIITREELLQGAKPILFNTEMVQAILDGRKTVTRRKIDKDIVYGFDIEVDGTPISYCNADGDFLELKKVAPYKAGGILYVRETFAIGSTDAGEELEGIDIPFISQCEGETDIIHKEWALRNNIEIEEVVWKPSIHMPKRAARIFLRVTDVRVERLQDIDKFWSNYDEEGMRNPKTENISIAVKEKFVKVWDSTIKKQDLDTYGWKANPYVWVIEFEVINYDK